MQNVPNFGSVMQAYILKKTIQELGHDVNFIDIKRNDGDPEILFNDLYQSSYESEPQGIRGKMDKYLFNRIKCRFLYNKQIKIIKKFQKDVLKLDSNSNEVDYDTCVIGSDEVFNCMQISDWGFSSQLFGNVQNVNKVITYAASCGSTKYDDLPEYLKNSIKLSLKKMSAISVRDENTYDFVSKLSTITPVYNLDPVVIGNFDNEIKNVKSNKNKKKYCIVYSYYNRIHDCHEIESIKSFCKKNNLEIVSVFTPQFWINKYMILNPFELLNCFYNADFVITDTFHGTIFSAKFSKKFAILIRDSNRNKLKDLVSRIDIDNHVINDFSNLDSIYKISHDKDKMKEFETISRDDSIKYLKENL